MPQYHHNSTEYMSGGWMVLFCYYYTIAVDLVFLFTFVGLFVETGTCTIEHLCALSIMVDSNSLGATQAQQQHNYKCTGTILCNKAPEKHGAMAALGTPKDHPHGNSARSGKWIIGSCDGIQKHTDSTLCQSLIDHI